MTNQNALDVLKLFYFGCPDMVQLSKKVRLPREEVREVLKSARSCGLISYSTNDYNEVFVNVKKNKLGAYLRSKGALR